MIVSYILPKVLSYFETQLLLHDLVQHRPRALGDFELNKDIAENLQKLVSLGDISFTL